LQRPVTKCFSFPSEYAVRHFLASLAIKWSSDYVLANRMWTKCGKKKTLQSSNARGHAVQQTRELLEKKTKI
jgi:hypothetical protein